MDFLELYNDFLLPVTKGKNGHFTNPIHILQYCDILKISDYNEHYPSLKETYSRLRYPICEKYFPTLTFLTSHKRIAHFTIQGRPKTQSKNQLDDFSLLPSQ